MIDRATLELAASTIEAELAARELVFSRVLRDEMSILASHRMLYSGMARGVIERLFSDELDLVSRIIWDAFLHFFSTREIEMSEETYLELKSQLSHILTASLHRLEAKMEECLRECGVSEPVSLDRAFEGCMSQLALKAEIFRDLIKKRKPSLGSRLPALDAPTREVLLRALSTISARVSEGGIEDFTKEEVMEWIERAREELEAPTPNRRRLKAYLGIITSALADTEALTDEIETVARSTPPQTEDYSI
ncbi:MAG: hypothetical protein QXX77_09300 [Candidatus Methanosuratincola sp.]